jgi:hypothetical protein
VLPKLRAPCYLGQGPHLSRHPPHDWQAALPFAVQHPELPLQACRFAPDPCRVSSLNRATATGVGFRPGRARETMAPGEIPGEDACPRDGAWQFEAACRTARQPGRLGAAFGAQHPDRGDCLLAGRTPIDRGPTHGLVPQPGGLPRTGSRRGRCRAMGSAAHGGDDRAGEPSRQAPHPAVGPLSGSRCWAPSPSSRWCFC